jgi:hypothetical protein
MRDAKKLMGFHDLFEEKTKKGNGGQIDKFGKGFNKDERFRSFKAEIYFSSHTGSCGSSSVSSFLRLESADDIKRALVKYLQDNEEDVIKGMASILDKKAKELVNDALIEVNNAQKAIDDISKYNPGAEGDHG